MNVYIKTRQRKRISEQRGDPENARVFGDNYLLWHYTL